MQYSLQLLAEPEELTGDVVVVGVVCVVAPTVTLWRVNSVARNDGNGMLTVALVAAALLR